MDESNKYSAKELYSQAYSFYDSKKYDRALEVCSRLLKEYPYSKEAKWAIANFPDIDWTKIDKRTLQEASMSPTESGSGAIRAISMSEKEIIVTDVKMPFGSMVVFMIKWAIASIPALIILLILFALLGGILGGILRGFMGY